ncbi:hypothetical protein BH09PSE6_BH09PSE6_11440 [soil metagenome]
MVTETTIQTPRALRLFGLALMAVAAVVAAIVTLHPERLNAPAWVAYSAAAVFAFGGVSMWAQASKSARLQAGSALALVLAMILPLAWIVFAPGERKCKVSLPFEFLASDLACRSAFGVSLTLVAVILVLFVRAALRGPKA